MSESASDADILRFVRRNTGTTFHPEGTCAMGAVVDAELRARGAGGLRAVDASIMPRIPRGNTNAPTIMIAEKAADLIRGLPPLPPAARGWTPHWSPSQVLPARICKPQQGSSWRTGLLINPRGGSGGREI